MLLEELRASFLANIQYNGERGYLEQQSYYTHIPSQQAALVSKQLLMLKQKQTMLEDGLLDSLQVYIVIFYIAYIYTPKRVLSFITVIYYCVYNYTM